MDSLPRFVNIHLGEGGGGGGGGAKHKFCNLHEVVTPPPPGSETH